MEAITSGVNSVITLAETMLTTVTGNPILTVVFASSFVGIAVTTLKRVFRASRL